ncbi:MAG: wax ester/triacylglycerol synthase domain-containing protein, partial [Candidatus Dormibacteria bacterium]
MGQARLERLTEADEHILELEHGSVAGHWCKVVMVDGRLDTARVRRAVGERIGATRRLRQRLEFLPRGFGRPVWVDDADFDLTWHVASVGTVAPLDSAQLRDVIASRMQERLDRSRPLWRLEVAPLQDGGTALLWRGHHCMADGFTAMRIGGECIWDDAEGAAATIADRTATGATRGALLTAAALDRGAAAVREARSLARDLTGVRHWREGLAQVGAVAASARRELTTAPIASCFDGPLGRRRAVA